MAPSRILPTNRDAYAEDIERSPEVFIPSGSDSPPATHDTSRIGWHMSDLEALVKNVEAAVSSSFPNHGASRYRSVNVAMMRWEDDDLGVEPEFNRLGDVFEKQYGFHVQSLIIHANEKSHHGLMSLALDFINDFDAKENLFILYYAGHGYINEHRQSTWVSSREAGSPTVDWSHIQGLFERSQSDVLILLDCCAATSAAPRQMNAHMETIAACGFEAVAPPPGMHSFTTLLIEVLEDWSNAPSFSVSMLFSEVLRVVMQRRKERCPNGQKIEWRRTPVHISNSKHPREAPIELCRRRLIDVGDFPRSQLTAAADESFTDAKFVAPTTYLDLMSVSCMSLEETLTKAATKGKPPATDATDSVSSDEQVTGPTKSLKTPHMLVSVELDQDQDLPSSEACRRWIASFPGLAKHVTVDGVYHGYSTVLILSIPVVIWDTLPDDPACRPITYVTSGNLLGDNTTLVCASSSAHINLPERIPTPTATYGSFHDDSSGQIVAPSDMDSGVSGLSGAQPQQPSHSASLASIVGDVEVANTGIRLPSDSASYSFPTGQESLVSPDLSPTGSAAASSIKTHDEEPSGTITSSSVPDDTESEISYKDEENECWPMVKVEAEDLNGARHNLLAILDSQAPDNFISSENLKKIGSVKTYPFLARQLKIFSNSVNPEGTLCPTHFARVKLHIAEIGYFTESLRVLNVPDHVVDGFGIIILGGGFMRQHGGMSLFERIADMKPTTARLWSDIRNHTSRTATAAMAVTTATTNTASISEQKDDYDDGIDPSNIPRPSAKSKVEPSSSDEEDYPPSGSGTGSKS